MFDLNKKEKPFTSFSGFGGGGLGLSGGVTKQLTYVDDVFSTFLYDGNSSTQTINNGIDLAGEGGLVWMKRRGGLDSHILMDTLRPNKALRSNLTTAEVNTTTTITSFNANGFSLGNPSQSGVNDNGENIVSWTFRKAPGFFDVVKYTGNGVVNRAVPHSLGSTPGCIIIKRTDSTDGWWVWHRSLNPAWTGSETSGSGSGGNQTGALELNTTEGFQPNKGIFTYQNNTAFGVYYSNLQTNTNGASYVAYVFAHDDAQFGTDEDESIIKCGSFNTPSSGKTSVNIGFEPQFVLLKRTNTTGSWFLLDTMRGMPNTVGGPTYSMADLPNAEVNGGALFAATSTGFDHEGQFGNSNTFIYMAIRRPNKPLYAFDPPLDATDVFAIDTAGATSPTPPWYNSGFVTDLVIRKQINSTQSPSIYSRIQGPKWLYTTMTSGENSGSNYKWDYMDGAFNISSVDSNIYGYLFKRAPGFMDVVAYEGAGGGTTNNVNHNLGVAPEMIIVKNRDAVSSWPVYHSATGLSRSARLQSTSMDANASGYWASAPTSTQFSPKGSDTNNTGSWIAYLFATLPGVSKVGSYSGNSGYAVNVPCGFTNGARFILIKRDGTGDWYVWDTSRGIASGNDPYWLVNSETAQVTNTDYVDPLSTGFTVTASAPAALNASGGTYIFLAIA